MKTFLRLSALMVVLLSGLAVLFAATGCGHVSQAAKQQVQKIDDDAAVKAAQAKADAKAVADKATAAETLLEQKAKANPVAHPIEAANLAVKAIRIPLIVVCILSLIVWLVSWGFSSTLPSLTKIGITVGSHVFFGSLAMIFSLPLFPWIFFGGIASAVVCFLVLLIRDKGNAGEAISTIESDVKTLDPSLPAASPKLAVAAAVPVV